MCKAPMKHCAATLRVFRRSGNTSSTIADELIYLEPSNYLSTLKEQTSSSLADNTWLVLLINENSNMTASEIETLVHNHGKGLEGLNQIQHDSQIYLVVSSASWRKVHLFEVYRSAQQFPLTVSRVDWNSGHMWQRRKDLKGIAIKIGYVDDVGWDMPHKACFLRAPGAHCTI